jgi:hypothetical protein
MRHPALQVSLFLFSSLFLITAQARLNCTPPEAVELYGRPLYLYDGKLGFDKQTVHIKNEAVIMLCYIREKAEMLVFWKSGLSVKEAEEFMKQSSESWSELKVEEYDNKFIEKHEEDFNFRLDPYLRQLRTWKSNKGDRAFFDSYRHELIIQGASLGSVQRQIPNKDFYANLNQMEERQAPIPSPIVEPEKPSEPALEIPKK